MSKPTAWFWSNWAGDLGVRRLSLPARGLWIDCLALMDAAFPRGYLTDHRGRKLTTEEIARFVNATPDEVVKYMDEIIKEGVASVDNSGFLYCRRLVRQDAISRKKSLNGHLGGKATQLKWLALSGLPQQSARANALAHGATAFARQLQDRDITPSSHEPREPAIEPTNQPVAKTTHLNNHPAEELTMGFDQHAQRQADQGLNPLRVRTAEECKPSPELTKVVRQQNKERGLPEKKEGVAGKESAPPSAASPELTEIIQRWRDQGLVD